MPLEGYAAWAIAVKFEDVRRHLGVETQRQWSDLAMLRTTRRSYCVRQAAWYHKTLPTFSDALALVRYELWARTNFCMSASLLPSCADAPIRSLVTLIAMCR